MRAGHGREFLDHRDFATGDDLRFVDWRASARSNTLQLNRYQDERASDWFICLDNSASMTIQGGDKWRLAAQLCAALSYLLLHLGHRVALLQFSDGIDAVCPLGRGHRQHARLVQSLLARSGTAAGVASQASACSGHAGTGCPLILISDFLQPDAMEAELNALWNPRRTMHAIQVLSEDEHRLPTSGVHTLRDSESGKQLRLHSGVHADTASNAIAKLQDSLRSHCASRRIQLSQATSRRDWRELLRDHFLGSPLN
jgi:uncharacterized protein (DUF58 family)